MIDQKLIDVREQADLLHIKYHHRAGVEKIQRLIDDHTSGVPVKLAPVVEKIAQETVAIDPLTAAPVKPMTKAQYRDHQRAENKRKVASLIRCRVQCMNPNKKEWPGEIISVGSAKLGTFKKFIPFNSGEPYHIPKIIYDVLMEKKCSAFYTVNDVHGHKVRKSRLISEYAIEVLPPLTKVELSDLARKQAMQAGQGA